jgi:uncharacterized protein
VQLIVRVKPGSRKGPLVEQSAASEDHTLTVYVQQRAVDGQANEAVVKLIAQHFGVPKSRVDIVRGHTSRLKTVNIDD